MHSPWPWHRRNLQRKMIFTPLLKGIFHTIRYTQASIEYSSGAFLQKMQFSRHVSNKVRNGEITASVKFWKFPQVMAGGHYPLADGEVVVTSIREINLDDITDIMARESGFEDRDDLIRSAQYGTGYHIYLIRFYFSLNTK